MAEMKLIGAVGIKVRPVATDFKRELASQINNLPEKTVNVKVDADTRDADRKIKDTQDQAGKRLHLNVGVDADGLRNAQQIIRQALKKVEDESVELKFNTTALNKAMADIDKKLGSAEVKMHVAQDEAGFRSVLSKIEQIKRAKTEILVPFKTDTKSLQKAEKEARERLRDIGIKIAYVPDRQGLEGAIAQIDAALRNLRKVEINPKLNKEELMAARAKLQQELASKPVVLKINKDVEGLDAALAKVRSLRREAEAVQFSFKTDPDSLKAAQEKLEKWKAQAIENAGVTISYKNDRKGLEGAIAELDKHLDKFRQLTVNPKLNEAALLKQKQKLQKELDAIPLEISYNEDRDGLKQAIAQLEELQRKAATVTIKYKNDAEGLAAQLDLMRKQLDAEPAELKIAPDKKGYEEALKQIEELQRQAKAITFEYQTDEQGLKDAADKLRKNIADLNVSPTIDFKYVNDSTGIRGALAEVEKELSKLSQVEVKVNLDTEGLEEEKKRLEQMLRDSSFKINVDSKDLNTLRKEREKIAELYREQTSEKISLDVEMNEASLTHAAHKIDELIREAEANRVQLDIEPVGLALAASQIGYASRSRVVPFFIRIDNKSRAVAEGVIKSLAGYNTLSSLGTGIENLVTNFDSAIIKGGVLATVIGGLVDTLAYGVTNALAIGEGMAEAVGLLATAPAALSAATAVVLVNIAAFTDFKAAIDGTKGALAKLPANAQAAALALRGTWEAIQQPIQDAYWESMGTSLQDLVSTLLPKVKAGLTDAGTFIGLFAKNTATTFTELGETDMFDNMFDNLAKMFENASGAAEPLTRAINTIGLRGSEYLPDFGRWLTDITTQFNDWIQAADEAGDINTWIEQGRDSLIDMWRAGDGVLDVIRGITTSAMNAGGTGLSEMADEMQRWGEIANGEPFQSRLTNIFKGAREGASALNGGFKNLTASLGENSMWLGDILTLLGKLGGVTLSNISMIFRNGTFRGGIYEAVRGLSVMVEDLLPSFENMGSVVGTLGRTASATFQGLAPLINNVTDALKTVTDILGDELPALATVLTGQLTNTFGAAAIVIESVARVVEPLLQLFLDMPGSIQTIILAAAGFQIMRGQISKMLTVLSERGHFKAFESSWTAARTHAGAEASRMAVANRMIGTSIADAARGTVSGFASMRTSLGEYRASVSNASGFFKTTGAMLAGPVQVGASLTKTAVSGLVGFLGGPLGVALAGAGIGLSLFAQHQQKAKAQADALRESLDQQTGAATENTKKLVATDWMQDGTGKWDNFWRGAVAGSEAAHETVRKLGESTADVTELITKGGPEYDAWLEKIKLVRDNITLAKQKEGGLYKDMGMSLDELSKKTGYSVDQLREMDAMSLDNLIGQTEKGRENVQKQADETKRLAEALGVGDQKAETMAKALDILGESSSTSAERVSALKDALDQINGGVISQEEATRRFAKAWETSIDDMIAANDNGVGVVRGSMDDLVSASDGSIADLSGRGGKLWDAAKKSTDALLELSASAYRHVIDTGGSVEDAQAAGVAALQLSEFQIEEFANATGVHVDKARMLLQRFIGEPWQAVALQVDSEFFLEKMAEAEKKGEKFGEAEWIAALKVRDLTNLGLDPAQAKGQNWADAEYTAVLKATPEEALATLAEVLGVTDDAWMRGDFSAMLKALDGTGPGVRQALLALALVQDGDYTAELQALVDALSLEQAKGELNGAADAKRSAHIDAVPHTNEAKLALDITANPRTAHITGKPHTTDAQRGLDNTALPRTSTITGVPNTRNAENNLEHTRRQRDSWYIGKDNLDYARVRLNALATNRGAWFIARADTGQAAVALANLATQRTVYYKAVVEGPGAAIKAANGAIINGKGVQTFANGGFSQARAFANGGVENHVAQISRGQTPYRIWSEPETGGEAYIPLASSKRQRSTQILEQVAHQFGMTLNSVDATQFANGGITGGGPSTGGGVAVNIGSYITQKSDTPDDVARALMRRIKAQGAYSPLEAF